MTILTLYQHKALKEFATHNIDDSTSCDVPKCSSKHLYIAHHVRDPCNSCHQSLFCMQVISTLHQLREKKVQVTGRLVFSEIVSHWLS